MLSVEVTLYAKDRGGRQCPITDVGYACLCKINPQDRRAYDCRINFYRKYPINPGEVRRADMFLMTGEDPESIFRKSGKLFLYEDRIIGEACLYSQRRPKDLGRGLEPRSASRPLKITWPSSGVPRDGRAAAPGSSGFFVVPRPG